MDFTTSSFIAGIVGSSQSSREARRGRRDFRRGSSVVVEDVMTTAVVTVAANMPIEDVRSLLIIDGGAPVVVVDDDGRLCGLITRTDALNSLAMYPDDAVAADAMNSLVYTLPMGASVERAEALLAYEGVGQLVITNGPFVVGLVTSRDVAEHFAAMD